MIYILIGTLLTTLSRFTFGTNSGLQQTMLNGLLYYQVDMEVDTVLDEYAYDVGVQVAFQSAPMKCSTPFKPTS